MLFGQNLNIKSLIKKAAFRKLLATLLIYQYTWSCEWLLSTFDLLFNWHPWSSKLLAEFRQSIYRRKIDPKRPFVPILERQRTSRFYGTNLSHRSQWILYGLTASGRLTINSPSSPSPHASRESPLVSYPLSLTVVARVAIQLKI